jgi:(E)-4-hydroxy-3-methylbut-2-enyl-diphosphate synthase
MKEQIKKLQLYCHSLTQYTRLQTREVTIGDIPLGAGHPIRIQSMTTTDTMNTIATVEQTIRMVNAGCEYVRITAPSLKEAQNLQEIKNELKRRGYSVPLIADIHYTPNAAELAARIVEKVRVNPGNYVDKKKFELIEYSDADYVEELERIRQRFTPLVRICKEYGTAMRIGTNHGSLSDRIMSRYGDTPLGMVESALEFLRICESENYYNIVLSMKASNPQVMVQAYRLLIAKMTEEGMNYPLHLGVTEAGDGEDGRVKSAAGIGSLLEDGIGDTVRVSLTEEPEYEAPVAISLVQRYKDRANHAPIPEVVEYPIDPFHYQRRKTNEIIGFGGNNVPRVVADYSSVQVSSTADLQAIGYFYDEPSDKWNMNDMAADCIYLGSTALPFDIPNGLRPLYDFSYWRTLRDKSIACPVMSITEFTANQDEAGLFTFVRIGLADLTDKTIALLKAIPPVILIIETQNAHAVSELRRIFVTCMLHAIAHPIIIRRAYSEDNAETRMLYPATDFASLLIDGLGDGVWATLPHANIASIKQMNRILFGVLQAARVRISKTEYIACPSCGRTLFDLVETTDKIRRRTEHLKGVKIAIMGCIVNGPGEMADADYGYVGAGPGKITLYRGKEVVKRNLVPDNAVDELIGLIRDDGKWIEPLIL